MDIRATLRAELAQQHADDQSVLIVDELGLCAGASRIDIAVVNSRLEGFEIKSPADTLARAESQVETYSRVFDYLTFVVGTKHVRELGQRLPNWVGLIEYNSSGVLLELKPAEVNTDRDPLAIAQLLWRDEALEVLAMRNLADGVRTKRKAALWARLADSVPIDELAADVRRVLKARSSWRADSRQSQDGGTSQLAPMT